MRKRNHRRAQAGFTIVELMVATVVFSVILIIITTGVIHITQTYNKGINLINTQNTARNIMDSISQSIQFSGGVVSWPQPSDNPVGTSGPVTAGRGCIGSQQYDFQLGYQVDDNPDGTIKQAKDALTLRSGVAGCSKNPVAAVPATPTAPQIPAVPGSFSPPAKDFSELIGQHMRLTKLTVNRLSGDANTDNLYAVAVTVVYGDYDLLCDTTYTVGSPGSCGVDAPAMQPTDPNFYKFLISPNLTCRGSAGSQYCAVSALSTVVQQRLTVKT